MKLNQKTETAGKVNASAAPPGGRVSAGTREIRIVAFPREFQKDYWKTLDKRMLGIFFINLVVVYGFLFYQALQPKPPASSMMNTRLLKKVAQIMKVDPKLLEDIEKKTEEKTDETTTASTVTAKASVQARTGAAGRAGKAAAAKAAAAGRAAAAAKAAAGRGVLAVAGAVGGSGGGKYAAVDFSGSSTGLDGVLGQLGSIGEAGGAGEKSVLGAGGTVGGGGGGIDELTAELGGSGGVSVISGQAGGGLIGVGRASVTGAGGGGASAADIQSVIDQNAAAVNACYTKELKKSPDLKGKLSVQIKINQAGRVAGVTVTSNTVGNEVSQCVQNKIRGWKFPRGKKGMITVNQTFVFTK